MKIKFINLLKFTLFIGVVICCFSCQDRWEKMGYEDYTDYTQKDLSKLKSPVILVGKSESMGNYNITVKDSCGTIRAYGNQSFMANSIGECRSIGDTLK
jgi:hypothetical protein